MGVILDQYIHRVLGENAHFPERRLKKKLFVDGYDGLWTNIIDITNKMDTDEDEDVQRMGFMYTLNQATVDLANWSLICNLHGRIIGEPVLTYHLFEIPGPRNGFNYLDIIFAYDNQREDKLWIITDIIDLLLIHEFEKGNDHRAPEPIYYQLSWRGKLALKEFSFFLYVIDNVTPWWPLAEIPINDENNNH
jgi:hypothetical protein